MNRLSRISIHVSLWALLYVIVAVILRIIFRSDHIESIIPLHLLWTIALFILPFLALPFYIAFFLWKARDMGMPKTVSIVVSILVIKTLPLLYIWLDKQPVTLETYLECLSLVLSFSLLGFLLGSFFNGIAVNNKNQLLQQEKLVTELDFLRSQINPHFLFNSLNNIDALIYSDSDVASASLNHLSSLMRYMLYETTSDQVALVKELNHLDDVIGLYKLRLSSNTTIDFVTTGEAGHKQVPPMLLIPLVENAFKHNDQRNPEAVIHISVSITDASLVMETSNPYQSNMPNSHYSGKGLSTLRKRLELLYPGRFELGIRSSDGIFTAKLFIQLIHED